MERERSLTLRPFRNIPKDPLFVILFDYVSEQKSNFYVIKCKIKANQARTFLSVPVYLLTEGAE